jgi:hypothetical protein
MKQYKQFHHQILTILEDLDGIHQSNNVLLLHEHLDDIQQQIIYIDLDIFIFCINPLFKTNCIIKYYM